MYLLRDMRPQVALPHLVPCDQALHAGILLGVELEGSARGLAWSPFTVSLRLGCLGDDVMGTKGLG
jgi:hypothetical protein